MAHGRKRCLAVDLRCGDHHRPAVDLDRRRMQLQITSSEKAEDRWNAPQALLAFDRFRGVGHDNSALVDVDVEPGGFADLEVKEPVVRVEPRLDGTSAVPGQVWTSSPASAGGEGRRDIDRIPASGTKEVKVQETTALRSRSRCRRSVRYRARPRIWPATTPSPVTSRRRPSRARARRSEFEHIVLELRRVNYLRANRGDSSVTVRSPSRSSQISSPTGLMP